MGLESGRNKSLVIFTAAPLYTASAWLQVAEKCDEDGRRVGHKARSVAPGGRFPLLRSLHTRTARPRSVCAEHARPVGQSMVVG